MEEEAIEKAAKSLEAPVMTIRADCQELGIDFAISIPMKTPESHSFQGLFTTLAQQVAQGNALDVRQFVDSKRFTERLERSLQARDDRHEFYTRIQKQFEHLTESVHLMKRDYYREIDRLREEIRKAKSDPTSPADSVIFFDPALYKIPTWETIVEKMDDLRMKRELLREQAGHSVKHVPTFLLCQKCREKFEDKDAPVWSKDQGVQTEGVACEDSSVQVDEMAEPLTSRRGAPAQTDISASTVVASGKMESGSQLEQRTSSDFHMFSTCSISTQTETSRAPNSYDLSLGVQTQSTGRNSSKRSSISGNSISSDVDGFFVTELVPSETSGTAHDAMADEAAKVLDQCNACDAEYFTSESDGDTAGDTAGRYCKMPSNLTDVGAGQSNAQNGAIVVFSDAVAEEKDTATRATHADRCPHCGGPWLGPLKGSSSDSDHSSADSTCCPTDDAFSRPESMEDNRKHDAQVSAAQISDEAKDRASKMAGALSKMINTREKRRGLDGMKKHAANSRLGSMRNQKKLAAKRLERQLAALQVHLQRVALARLKGKKQQEEPRRPETSPKSKRELQSKMMAPPTNHMLSISDAPFGPIRGMNGRPLGSASPPPQLPSTKHLLSKNFHRLSASPPPDFPSRNRLHVPASRKRRPSTPDSNASGSQSSLRLSLPPISNGAR